ncbi:MAG TPA: lactonase family protein [Verrucomicrobiae bacterium]|nr:lactonase family protein [Verrucomicrobiae bacterium]
MQDDQSSRRRFLTGAAALAVGNPASVRAAKKNPAGGGILAYVGSYSSPQGPEGSRGRGKGIYLFEVNRSTGGLTQREIVPNESNPSWLAFNPAKTHLYSGNETGTFEGAASGSVSAYRVDPASGHLMQLDTVSSRGAGPAQLSVHPSGKFVLVANYAGGTVAVLAVRGDGSLGETTDVKHDSGAVGPAKATSAPPGSFAISGHDRPHAHMIHSDPSGRFVLATDLGMDRIFVWKFDDDKGKLLETGHGSVALPPGDGPRHFCFHPNGRWMYSLQEEGSTLVLFDFDPSSGALAARQTISTLPKGFAGTSFTSEVALSPDARFVYAANRLHDTIAWFSVGSTGTLTFSGEEWTRGDYPRSFSIDPSGNFLYSCNQRSDVIATFRVHRETGRLAFTGQYTPVGTPAILVFR